MKNNGSSVLLYRLPATAEQKKTILDAIYEINKEGSAYNLLGVLFKFSFKPNIMFCSQFVYTMLEKADLAYFNKPALHVEPMDFVELDYQRQLQFIKKISFSDVIKGA